MGCKGICQKYKAIRDVKGRYLVGQKRCQICEIFLSFEGLKCPCCSYKLRTKPRKSRFKAKIRNETHTNSERQPKIMEIINGEIVLKDA